MRKRRPANFSPDDLERLTVAAARQIDVAIDRRKRSVFGRVGRKLVDDKGEGRGRFLADGHYRAGDDDLSVVALERRDSALINPASPPLNPSLPGLTSMMKSLALLSAWIRPVTLCTKPSRLVSVLDDTISRLEMTEKMFLIRWASSLG
ncbi:hypothetical protein Q9314_22830 (plasmid) [Shinella sumterensis]|nr:hypothetical protein Q9314_22830 [Shinella sumterensis]